MTEEFLATLRIAFWLLAVATAIAPFRWALLGFILISHIDVTTTAYASASSIGIENTVRTVALPAILVLRFARHRVAAFPRSPLMVLWIALTLYAALACLWSSFQLSGLKMVAYMVCYSLVGILFLEGWEKRQLTSSIVAAALWISLAMAAIQTYVLGNPFGMPEPSLNDNRFTSFCSPQQFGAFLLATLAILLVTSRHSMWSTMLHAMAGFTGIILCGSRYVFLGSLCLLPIVWVSHVVRHGEPRVRIVRLVTGALGFVLVSVVLGTFVTLAPENRINQLLIIGLEGGSPFDSIGTFVWRKGIYTQAWDKLSQRDTTDLIVGTGTSSGAEVVLGWDKRYFDDRIDANRVVHNEVIRVLFEWGLIGLGLFASIGLLFVGFIVRAIKRQVIPAYAVLAIAPTILFGCLSENILAGAASPGGVGFSLAIFYGVSYFRFAQQVRTPLPILPA